MKISFRKLPGEASLGIICFWQLFISSKSNEMVLDNLIPELTFDFIFVKTGSVKFRHHGEEQFKLLPEQSLRSIQTARLEMTFQPPLVLMGAHFRLDWAERFWELELPANECVPMTLINQPVEDFAQFKSQITEQLREKQIKKTAGRMVDSNLAESKWLASYSDRQKRRLYKSTFGLSRKEMQKIYNVGRFLDQSCNFSDEDPHIIDHVNPEHFYDQPHLNRTFRQVTGLTLLEYFEANTILQDNLMAVSYNENVGGRSKLEP